MSRQRRRANDHYPVDCERWCRRGCLLVNTTITALYQHYSPRSQYRWTRIPCTDPIGQGPGSGLEDDPAGDAAGGLRAVRLGCLRERVHRADLRAQVPLVDGA